MFERTSNTDDRGQVGIGTLIVFIAMVLVAAIAAGVLINTAGFLQSKSEATGQESSSQVSDRLQEVGVTGSVSGNQIDVVDLVVSQAAGADEIDLTNVTVTWIGPTGTYQLVHESYTNTDASGGDGFFTVGRLKDADSSSPVLNSPDDRLVMTFDVGDDFGSNDLDEGEDVTLKINTQAGATTSVRFTVPQSLTGKTAVEL